MKRYLIYICISLGFLFTGCEKSDEYVASPQENFEALWKILDENYCFFEYKDIDWNEVHDRYKTQISDTMNQYVLFDVLGDMLNELKDGHTNLISTFNMSRYWDWYLDYPDNFDSDIQENYLGRNYSIAGGLKYTTLSDGQIGYIYYGSFSSSAGESGLDHIFYQFKDCKGLIFDIRDNGGGMLSNADRIASRFLEEKILTGYIQHIRWLRPVVVLTNRHCYSAANDFVQKVRMMPYVTTMGDRTGGGSGFPFNSELPNGWGVRFSAAVISDAQGNITEFGVAPHVKVDMSDNDRQRGIDTMLETAFAVLSSSASNKSSL